MIRRSFTLLGLLLALTGGACRSTEAADPEIVGSTGFSNRVHEALVLLKARDTNAYVMVTNYVGRIKEAERTGLWAYEKPPTYEMSLKTAAYSVTWCAATIAHDSFHSKLYHDYRKAHGGAVPDSVWTGTIAEKGCMKHQLLVMERIGSPKWELDHAKKQTDGHYVKDGETWEEYKNRKW